MPIISSTVFPWGELHNDFQEPIIEGGIPYPSITHYVCAMTQLTGVAIRYIVNEPITSRAIELAHSYYTKELNRMESNSIYQFYYHAVQQNQLFADTLESIIDYTIAYHSSTPEYPYITPNVYMNYQTDSGAGYNTIGNLLMKIGDKFLYRPDMDRRQLAYVGDDNILSPLFVFAEPVMIDSKPYYSALEYSYTNLFVLIGRNNVDVPLTPVDMMIQFKLLEQERLDTIVKRLLPNAIRKRFQTINMRRLLLTAYTIGDVDYEITYSENYLPNELIANITSGVHTNIVNKIVDQNERCQDDINCVYSGRLIRPYFLIRHDDISRFTYQWVMGKMKRLLTVFNGVCKTLYEEYSDTPFLFNAFLDTMYTTCGFIRFSDSLVDTTPIEVVRDIRDYMARAPDMAKLEQSLTYEHNLFIYLLWSYGSYLITWLNDYGDVHEQTIDRLVGNITVHTEKERQQAEAQCIKQLLDFYTRIGYQVTRSEVRKSVLVVFGVEDEAEYYDSDVDTYLQSRIQFYSPITKRTSSELNKLLELKGVPASVPSRKVSSVEHDEHQRLLEMVDPAEFDKPVRTLKRRQVGRNKY
jgi:hypothetical protein